RAARRAVDKHRARPEAVLAAATIGLATSKDPKPFLRTGSSAALAIGRFGLAAEYATQLVDLATGLVERADAHRLAALACWHLGDIEGFATNFAAASKFTSEAYDQRVPGAA